MTKFDITYFLLIGDGSFFILVEKADEFSYYLRCTYVSTYILFFLTEIIHDVISLGAMKIISLIENKELDEIFYIVQPNNIFSIYFGLLNMNKNYCRS